MSYVVMTDCLPIRDAQQIRLGNWACFTNAIAIMLRSDDFLLNYLLQYQCMQAAAGVPSPAPVVVPDILPVVAPIVPVQVPIGSVVAAPVSHSSTNACQ